jgi:hypothetical protein
MLLMMMGVALAQEPVALWDQVAAAAGQAAWSNIDHIQFTWTHVPSSRARTYDWNVPSGLVTVTMEPGAQPHTVAVFGTDLDGEQLDAHKAFVNDSYWLLFEFKAVTDTATRAEVPPTGPFDAASSAYEIQYPVGGGYTPGDRYVVYVHADGHPVGWSHFPGGSDVPDVSTTRAGRTESSGITVPTVFDTPDGQPFVRISDFRVTRY